jgi:hypothetical protein
MKTTIIKFAAAFTDCPGGRSRIDGDFSGEQFREDLLEPALARYDHVILDLNGVFSFPSSFVNEAFGVLASERGLEVVRKQLTLKLEDNPLGLDLIEAAMAAA